MMAWNILTLLLKKKSGQTAPSTAIQRVFTVIPAKSLYRVTKNWNWTRNGTSMMMEMMFVTFAVMTLVASISAIATIGF